MAESNPHVTTSTADPATADAVEPVSERTFALLHPDGTLTWRSAKEESEVNDLVGGYHGPRAVTTSWLGPGCQHAAGVLRVRASDLCLTPHYAANSAARRAITEMSHGYVSQRWGGVVALVEYERDPHTGEVGFPQPMSEQYIRRLSAFYSLSHVVDD